MQTPDSNQPAPADYHAGLLRLWREGAGGAWRASLQLAGGVPLIFSLGGDQGLTIFAQGYPKSQPIVCDSGAPGDDIEQTVTAGASSLSYDAAAGQYSYTWKTDKKWAGTCRQLIVHLVDGTEHSANFKFK